MNYIVMIFVLSVLEFVISLYLGLILFKHKFDLFRYGTLLESESPDKTYIGNLSIMLFWPSLFLTLCCSLAQIEGYTQFIRHAYYLIIGYWIIRTLYTILSGKSRYINKGFHFITAVFSIGLGALVWRFFVMELLISNESILIPLTDFRNAVWFAIICLFIKMIWEILTALCEEKQLYPTDKKKKAFIEDYNKFRGKYQPILDNIFQENKVQPVSRRSIEVFIYAIMIYENYNRPLFLRCLERLLVVLKIKKVVTQGIMQYPSSQTISDEESVALRAKEVIDKWDYRDTHCDEKIAKKINARSDYYDSVYNIADYIAEGVYKKNYIDIKKEVTSGALKQIQFTEEPVSTFVIIHRLMANGEYQEAISFLKYLEKESTGSYYEFNEPLFMIYGLLEIAYEKINDYEMAMSYREKARKMFFIPRSFAVDNL